MTNCDCSNNGIKAYFKLDYKPNKLSQLANDTHYVDINDVLDEINTHNTSETAHTYIQGRIDATNTTIGDLTELDTSVKTSVVDAINSEVSARGNADTALENDYNAKIGTLSNLDSSVKTDVVSAINSVISDEATIVGDLDDLDTSVKTSIVTAINSEVSDRQSADSGLQTQIDALAASSDVTDIVGTYAELQAYDTQHLNDNDIIKVLDDSTHNDAPSYYRYDKSTDSFTYIGSESASYTKAESDALFVPQTRTVNSKPLSADITLTSSDVGALASTTTINDLTTIAQQNALNSGATTTNIGQIATNTSSISTINGKIPSDASSSNKLVTASALSNAVVNLADKDLSNLTETGEERLHALKAYSDNGELLTDQEGLENVIKYAHSSFGLSKFTVVGTPNITDDGIASGFGNNNYLNTNIVIGQKPFKIRAKVNYANTVSGQRIFQIGLGGNQTIAVYTQIYGSNPSALRISGTLSDDTSIGDYIADISGDVIAELEFTGSEYILRVYNVAGTLLGSKTITSSLYIKNVDTLDLLIGTNATDITYDLKYFDVDIDGVEVFSGNKTGIDVIKPNDYTVVGTPTISADGVASGFSSDNYVELPFQAADIKSGTTIYIPFKTTNAAAQQWLIDYSTLSGGIALEIINSKLRVRYFKTSSSYDTPPGINNLLANTDYIARVEYYNVGTTYNVDVYLSSDNGATWVKEIAHTSSSALYTTNANMTLGGASGISAPLQGSIDLNSFKIYVDGNLVYQPCLKIPYTQSKTGSKIVNAIYRGRVNDMAEQFGYANYYTLDEDNGNFTLPQVELYGLLGDKRLVDSYYNGLTYWELYSNRRLEQGGTCESGVEYTFTKPFIDTNYVLTIPYSSKTATTFIPSATGDFIAKGTGTL